MMRIRFAGLAAALALGVAATVAAQGPTASARRTTAGIRGVVYDSLVTDRVLAGAEVYLEGTASVVRTDGRGVYSFTGLPAGAYKVGFSHPVLDSIGVTLPLRDVTVQSGTTVDVPLTTPSLRTLYPRVCGGAPSEKTGLVIGRVSDADADSVVAAVTVEAEWTAMILQRGVTPKNGIQTARAQTDANGRFFLCGVPTDVALAVRVGRADKFGPVIQLDLDGKGVVLQNLSLSLGDVARATPVETPAQRPTPYTVSAGAATVQGVVTDDKGVPIEAAEVRVIGASAPAVRTNTSGAYSLGGLPAGTATLEVRAFGYGPYRTITELRRGRTTTIDATISIAAQQLDPVAVTGFSTLFDRSGFEDRRKAGNGHFITDEDIRRRAAVRTEDVFRGIPTVQLIPSGLGGYTVIMPRASGQVGVYANRVCYPSYYIDGAAFNSFDPELSGGLPIVPEDIRGIEVYASLSAAPPQYQRLESGCGIILIWTKRGAPTNTFGR